MTRSAPLLASNWQLPVWLHWLSDRTLLVSLGVGFAILGAVSLFLLPVILANIPADYFASPALPARSGTAKRLARIVKNLLGALLLMLGIAMLVLPGQGLLTILVALILLDFPGKRRCELWLVQRPRVLRAMNSLRSRAGRPPFRFASAKSITPTEPLHRQN